MGGGACGVPRDMTITTTGEALVRAIKGFLTPEADCEVPPHEPCFLRYRPNCLAIATALELAGQLQQMPDGAQKLAEMMASWAAEPEARAARLHELIMRPAPTSPDADGPWPGYL